MRVVYRQQRLPRLTHLFDRRKLLFGIKGYRPEALKVTRDWLRAKANSIEGGTSEVNLNIVAKRVLGLRDHRVVYSTRNL